MSIVNKHKAPSDIQTPPSGYTTLFIRSDTEVPALKDSEGNVSDLVIPGDASGVTYTPSEPLNWTDSVDPGNVDDALDDLALRVVTLESAGQGSGVGDGDYGDITVSGGGTVFNIDAGVVTTTELGGDITTAGKALLDDADTAAQRITLGLGTIATQNSSNVSITGGTVTGITDITVADGGTGVSSLTAYAPIFGGTTSTGAVQSGTVGTSGQVLTSNGAGALPTFQSPLWTEIIAASDQNKSSDTTLATDSELFFTMTANKAYAFEAYILYSSPVGGATPDFKIAFTGPATLSGQYFVEYYITNTDAIGAYAAIAAGSPGTLGTSTSPRLAKITGWMSSTAGGTGSSGFQFQWAQSVSNANNVTRLAGSILRYRQITP